jgi:lipopolysaccharide biosynthesis glycosyltransferase
VIRIFTGFDQREAVGWSVFCRSVIENTTTTVSITPIDERIAKSVGGRRDGTTAFSFARFLVPALCDFHGWALWCDGVDMLALGDLKELWARTETLESMGMACYVAKHFYKTRNQRKFIGSAMETDNPPKRRHNWSSVILWNCANLRNRDLTPDYIRKASGKELHQFEWLKECEERIGELPLEWNWLVGEYDPNPKARLLHFTLGIPSLSRHYDKGLEAKLWRDYLTMASRGMNC